MTDRARYRQAAWSWSEHLRHGGVTPWAAWRDADHTDVPVPEDWVVPGAAQLELVRRLAGRGLLRGDGFPALADVVLGRSGPGRGLAEQPLSWPATAPQRRFGAPPVDPAEVPEEELVRLGVGTLTELLLGSGLSAGAVREPSRRRFTRSPAFELAGAPVSTAVVRRGLATAGHLPGGRSPRVLVLAEPLDELLAQVWSTRVQGGAAVRWHGFVQRWAGHRGLPPSADIPAIARSWAERVGAGRVHVLVAPGDATSAVRAAAGILGVDPFPAGRVVPPRTGVRDLAPAAVDVLRRVNTVLGVRADRERRAAVRRHLVGLLGTAPGSGGTGVLTVPEPFQGWARDRAARVAGDLTGGGYPVHGALGLLVPRFEGRRTHPRRADVLDLVLDACLRIGATTEGGTGGG